MKKLYLTFIVVLCAAYSYGFKTTITSTIRGYQSNNSPAIQVGNATSGSFQRKVYFDNGVSHMPELSIALREAEKIFSKTMRQELIDLVDIHAEVLTSDEPMDATELCKVQVEYTDTLYYNTFYKFGDFVATGSHYLGILFPSTMTNQTRGASDKASIKIYLNPNLQYHCDTTLASSNEYDVVTILLRALAIGCGIQSSIDCTKDPVADLQGVHSGGYTYITAYDSQIFNDSAYTYADVALGNVSILDFLLNHEIYSHYYYSDYPINENRLQLHNDWYEGLWETLTNNTINNVDYFSYTDDEIQAGFCDLLDADLPSGLSIREVTPYTLSLLRQIGWIKMVATGEAPELNALYNSSLTCSSNILLKDHQYFLSNPSNNVDLEAFTCKLFSNDSTFVIGNVQDNMFWYSSIPEGIQWQRNPVTKNILGQFQAEAYMFYDGEFVTQPKSYDIEIPYKPNKPIVQRSEITENDYIQLHLKAFADGSNTYTVSYTGATYSDTHTFTISANILDTTILDIPATQLYNMTVSGSNNVGTSDTYNFTFGFSANPPLTLRVLTGIGTIRYLFTTSANTTIYDIPINSVNIIDASGHLMLSSTALPGEQISVSSLPNGRYSLIVFTDENTYIRSFMKR